MNLWSLCIPLFIFYPCISVPLASRRNANEEFVPFLIFPYWSYSFTFWVTLNDPQDCECVGKKKEKKRKKTCHVITKNKQTPTGKQAFLFISLFFFSTWCIKNSSGRYKVFIWAAATQGFQDKDRGWPSLQDARGPMGSRNSRPSTATPSGKMTQAAVSGADYSTGSLYVQG